MVAETNGNLPPAQELETFLPSDGSKRKENISAKYKVSEMENGGAYDPFRERKVDHPTTDCDTLTHLLKASLGTGILAMPAAFKNAGLVMGIIFTVLVAVICTHCAYILVKCAHHLYKKQRVPAMSFSEVSVAAFSTGPQWCRKFAYASKVLILISLFLTYFGTCSVYTVIIAGNLKEIIVHHTGNDIDLRVVIATLLVPLILLSWIPNLKYLAPVSMLANVFMGVGLGITFYYLFRDMPSSWDDLPYVADFSKWPDFFSITIFAMEAIGVVMPLENSMKTPEHFVGICGVLNKGMSGVTMIYIFLGFLGYVCYGDKATGSVTLNLPVAEIPAQVVMVLIAIAVFCTFGLQFYVCLEIVWDGIKDKFQTYPTAVNYVMRTVLVTAATVLAIAVPTIEPFIGLIGAFCFSILGLLIPVIIETVTFWDTGFGKFNWIIWKNVLVFAFGLFALVFGTMNAVREIIRLYQ